MKMPRTEEAEAFYHAVYSAIQEIPYGKVTTYGHIGRLIGTRVCLKHLPSDPTLPHHNNNVPWQRVINSKGTISPRNPNGAANQAQALGTEGVTVTTNAIGEFSINLAEYGWFPRQLPSEEAAGLEPYAFSDDEDEE
ncbi:hypothetical protein HYALB_00008154 [Hymenoscyphus albidus]|uniref:Methylated-DNA-[protein]-cysteine S-methyltransferase DNA binding domain-containing protein n=1 Tax=Hymenoscyphus albidus TaxID=595503 RepID=A0A9N9M2A2_9HELO|nr:hypothetical protein HYALB_00008154 [Hymenoscyphus albidus]